MTIKYKTNINCENCIRSVTNFLNDVQSIDNWHVDIENPQKVLTVEGTDIDAEEVENAVEEAGFDLTRMGMWKN